MATFDRTYYAKYFLGNCGSWRKAARKRAYFYRALLNRARKGSEKLDTVIEIGCGTGFFSEQLSQLSGIGRVYSSDLSKSALSFVQENLGSASNIHALALDAQELAFPNEFADLVVCLDVVEHLPSPERFFAEARRVLRPGGCLLFSTPNPASLGAIVKGKAGRRSGTPYELRAREWHGYRDDSHISIKAIPEWRSLAVSSGLERVWDGSDYWWDTPYFRNVPTLLQKVVFNGAHHILTRTIGLAGWHRGENYYGLWRRPARARDGGGRAQKATPHTRSETVRAMAEATR